MLRFFRFVHLTRDHNHHAKKNTEKKNYFKMDEEQLAGGVAFCRLVLNQPELRLDDLCRASTINRLVADFDKRPTLRQCEPNPNVSSVR